MLCVCQIIIATVVYGHLVMLPMRSIHDTGDLEQMSLLHISAAAVTQRVSNQMFFLTRCFKHSFSSSTCRKQSLSDVTTCLH